MIGAEFESNLNSVGGSASSGNRPRTRSMRVRMSFIASLRSRPHEKFSRRLLLPSWEFELICSSARRRAQRLLERPRNQLFHLQRSDAGVVDAHRDRRLLNVGEQVHGQTGQRDGAQQDDDRADHRHHDRALNGEAGDAHATPDAYDCGLAPRPTTPPRRWPPRPGPPARSPAGRTILSPSRSAAAPVVTTRSPSDRPDATSTS